MRVAPAVPLKFFYVLVIPQYEYDIIRSYYTTTIKAKLSTSANNYIIIVNVV